MTDFLFGGMVQGNTPINISSAVVAANVSVTGSGLPTVGLFSPGTNQLGFATNSVQQMVINSSGQVGIGSSIPAAALDVVGTANFTSRLLIYTQGSSNLAGISTNATIIGTVAKNVSPSGGQGTLQIHSNDPDASSLQGSISLITDPTAANRRLTFQSIEQGVAGRNITFQENGGSVGIGTNAPGYPLDIYVAANALTVEEQLRNDNAGTGVAALGFNVTSTVAGDTSVPKAGIGLQRSSPQGVGNLIFYNRTTQDTSAFTASDERMRLDSTGALQVGGTTVTNTTGYVNSRTNARAWITFVDNGSVAVSSNYNVSSVTRNAASDYTLNYATALATATYAFAGMSGANSTSMRVVNQPYNAQAPSTTSLRVIVTSSDGVLGPIGSTEIVSVVVFGN
jgi:hypothetical protein